MGRGASGSTSGCYPEGCRFESCLPSQKLVRCHPFSSASAPARVAPGSSVSPPVSTGAPEPVVCACRDCGGVLSQFQSEPPGLGLGETGTPCGGGHRARCGLVLDSENFKLGQHLRGKSVDPRRGGGIASPASGKAVSSRQGRSWENQQVGRVSGRVGKKRAATSLRARRFNQSRQRREWPGENFSTGFPRAWPLFW